MGGRSDLEFAKETEDFGSIFKKDDDVKKSLDDLEGFMDDLVAFVERRVYNKLAKKVNFLLTRVNDQKFEFVADGNKDKDEDGNWRIVESSGDLVIQKRISGTWTNANRFAGS